MLLVCTRKALLDLVVFVLVTQASLATQLSGLYQRHQGNRATDSVTRQSILDTFQASLFQCAASCNLHTDCGAFNYNAGIHGCELVAGGEQNLDIGSQDWNYYSFVNQETAPVTESPDWVTLETGRYLVSSVKNTWDRAQAACKELGAHLLKLDTIEEYDTVQTIVERMSYIGGRSETPSEFMWEDGTRYNLSGLWDSSEPSPSIGCMAYKGNGKLASEQCSVRYHYICEMD